MACSQDLVLLARLDTVSIELPDCTHILHKWGGPGDRHESLWKRPLRPLGRGGMGEVYREECIRGTDLGALRAVKVIQKPDSLLAYKIDYTRELDAVVEFSKPEYKKWFVESSGWFETDDSVFIAMELVEHGDLARCLQKKFLPEPEARIILVQLLEGLSFMHKMGFAHRDLKPQNLLVVSKGPEWHIKLADFGLSKRVIASATSFRSRGGTPAFMAPEVLGFVEDETDEGPLRRSYTNAVDIWAAGVILFWIVTGQLPFPSQLEDGQVLKNYVKGRAAFPTEAMKEKRLSADCLAIASSFLSPNAKDRPTAKMGLQHRWFANAIDALSSQASASWDFPDSVYSTGIETATSAHVVDRSTSKTSASALLNGQPEAKPSSSIRSLDDADQGWDGWDKITFHHINPEEQQMEAQREGNLQEQVQQTEAQKAEDQETEDQEAEPQQPRDREAEHQRPGYQRLRDQEAEEQQAEHQREAQLQEVEEQQGEHHQAKHQQAEEPPYWRHSRPATTTLDGLERRLFLVADAEVVLSSDGRTAAALVDVWGLMEHQTLARRAEARVLIWDATTGGQISQIRLAGSMELTQGARLEGLTFTPSGRLWLIGGTHSVREWNPKHGLTDKKLGEKYFVTDLAFSPDGRFAAGTCRAPVITRDPTHGDAIERVEIWDVSSSKRLQWYASSPADTVKRTAFSPDGKRLAIWNDAEHSTVSLRDIESGHIKRKFIINSSSNQWPVAGPCFLSFSWDGTLLAAVLRTFATSHQGGFMELRLWEVTTGFEHRLGNRRIPMYYGDVILSINTTADLKLVIAVARGNSVLLWDIETGVVCHELVLPSTSDGKIYAQSFTFSPSGRPVVGGLVVPKNVPHQAHRLYVWHWNTSIGLKGEDEDGCSCRSSG